MDQHDTAAEISAILVEQADRLFGEHATSDVLAAADAGEFPQKLWRAIEESGLTRAMVSEERGGAGIAPADSMRLVRLAGYHTLPVPLPETMSAAWLWAMAGGEVPDGPLTLAPVRPDDVIEIEFADDGAARLNGTAARVPWGSASGHCLVVARTRTSDVYGVLAPTAQVAMTPRRNLAHEPRETLKFDGQKVTGSAVRPMPSIHAGEGILALGAVLRAQQMVGAMERCMQLAIEHATNRVQFGRPIAKFQAVQHMLAVAAGHVAAATALADEAIDMLEGGDLPFAAALAKARTGEAAGEVAATAHQVLGAMGFTHEHPLHFATRRLWSWREEFGAEAFWEQRIGDRICRAGGESLWLKLAG